MFYSLTVLFFGGVKKALHLFMLIPVFLHAGGLMLLCTLLQLNIQKEAESALLNPETKLTKITLSNAEYQNCKLNNKEIKLNGKLFDIKNAVFNNDQIELLAYEDVHESGIISLIENFFSPENSKKDFPQLVLKLLVSVFTIDQCTIIFEAPASKNICTSFPAFLFDSFKTGIITPPPEIMV